MLTFKQLTVVVAATLVWGLCAPGEQIPAGTYTNSFSGTAGLYDITGTYQQSVAGLTLNCTVNMDSTGKFTGAGAVDISDFTSYGASGKIDATYSGTVKSAKNVTRVSLTLKMKGYLVVEGENVKVSANMKETMDVDQANRQMSGTVSGSVTASVPGHGSKTQKIPPTPVALPLPANEDGSWTLTLNLAPVGKKYSGTGTMALVGGGSYPITIMGTYAPKSDMSKLTLKGQRAMTLTMAASFQNAQMQFQSLKGKALGQSPHSP